LNAPITIFFAGGGSGGHLYPGIAVAEALRERLPAARPLFLCTQREIDSTILTASGFEFIAQPIVPPRRSMGGLLRFWRAWRQTQDLTRQLIKDRRPAAVLGLGGYAAGVAVRAAAKRKIPTAIVNPDVIPGKANQFLFNHVERVFCQFAATRDHVPATHHAKLVTTGCPIRSEITALPSREAAMSRLGLNPMLQTLVVTGASQGAVTVNDAVLESWKQMKAHAGGAKLQGWQILHLSGKENAERVRAEYRELEVPAIVLDFTPAMGDVWAVADLAISRAGASSCAELLACAVPSILMPYPFHKDNHQLANGRALEAQGAAIVVDDLKDRAKNAAMLRPALESLLYDATRRQAMRASARRAAPQNAALAVADALVDMIGRNAG
jgi:UDP-N-acetylglucosamine--N-acetylmuramyl-(pentapeptide) pyrophosphoryl-undecaprenol N-acetylglucosamine transferase